MKKLLFVACTLFAVQSFGQDKAKICFIRDTGFVGSAGDFKEFVDDKIICKLDNKSYNFYEVSPGEHSVTWQPTGKEINKIGEAAKIKMDMEAGKTYYFQMTLTKKFMTYDYGFVEVTEGTAKKLMTELKEDTNCFK